MRALAILIALTCGCVRGHFDEVARATVRCDQSNVTKVHWWAYQIDACGEVSFARCWYAPDSGKHRQCCRSSTEDEARNLHASEESEQGAVCWDYDD
jgi:hypothetical protein